MKFTVVIPTYNRGDIISKSLDSVFSQTFKDWEIIVVDNCSTDDTAEVMQKYLDSGKVTYVVNDRNYERSYSRNRGMKMAKGDYVTLLDSDDILYEDCLQSAVDYIKENPDDSFFHCLFELLGKDYQVIKRENFPKVSNPFKAIAEGNFISNIGVFYKKELLEKVKFDEEPIIIGSEDYDFVMTVLLTTGRVGRIDKFCCGVYDHGGRTVHTGEWEKTYKRIRYFTEKQVNSPLFQSKMQQYKNLFLAHINLYLASFCASRGMTRKAFYYIFEAARKYPMLITGLKFWKHIFVTIKRIFK